MSKEYERRRTGSSSKPPKGAADPKQPAAKTQNSPNAEPASGLTESKTLTARRLLDELILRDRVFADDALAELRTSADRTLAEERSPSADRSIIAERRVNDAGKHAERNATDGLLGRERARADSLMDTTRREADAASLDTDALEDADRARRWSVLPMVTHDLRSPLGMIALNAQMIAEDSNESSIRDAARDISRSSSHMGRLLMDLLDVARFESGTFSVRPLQHDVGEFLSALLRSHVRLFAQREITFLVEAPTEIVKARFDRDRLTQVLTNLLGNAMKFTPRHGTVVLSVVKQADGVEFAVCDSGPGIAAVAMATLFERFSQVDNDSRRGLGLGLHICKQIVTAHHGRIWVDADQTKGATFRFTLPD